ncbi:MAG TPA: Asp-tRNA(Asn)/Glu-tRNA(Gln) amidotransferase subunit GatA [Gammaproteobacteria bacterium]|nr:Asp-tRNA(Asn)/Glu-tRNA(Gln) amidotransferase subunit GatA [Gammaproteobacteria bacterium]
MNNFSLHSLSTALHHKTVSAVELAQIFLARIEQFSRLNAFITVDSKFTLAQAQAADQLLQQTDSGPLTGIPLAHKDIFCSKGLLTSCGSKILSNFIAPYNATVVERLNNAGMVTLGKTNMDEFAMGSSNESSWYGPVHNPWNENCVPGGSSGGSAAAVAARLAPIATGTDTGGSIRQPAAFCGLTGIKPSYGRVSRYGMIAFASSLDQGGVLAQSARDAAMLLQTMSGHDPKDSTSVDRPVPDFMAQLEHSLAGKRIGLPKEFFGEGIDSDVAKTIEQAVAVLKSLGAIPVEISLTNSPLSIPCYYVIAPAEASSNLSRFDGVRYGHRAAQYHDLIEMYERSRSEGFGEEVKRRIMIGSYVLSSGYYDAYYIKAQKLRRLIADDFQQAFKACDVIVGPTTPSTAFQLNAKAGDPVAMYLNDIFTCSANLAGLPGISLPAGFDQKGMPIGLQLIGRYFDESSLLNMAHRYQQQTNWHQYFPKGYQF